MGGAFGGRGGGAGPESGAGREAAREDPESLAWGGGAERAEIWRPEGRVPGSARVTPGAFCRCRAPRAQRPRCFCGHLPGRSVRWGPETHLISALCRDSFEACGGGGE